MDKLDAFTKNLNTLAQNGYKFNLYRDNGSGVFRFTISKFNYNEKSSVRDFSLSLVNSDLTSLIAEAVEKVREVNVILCMEAKL